VEFRQIDVVGDRTLDTLVIARECHVEHTEIHGGVGGTARISGHEFAEGAVDLRIEGAVGILQRAGHSRDLRGAVATSLDARDHSLLLRDRLANSTDQTPLPQPHGRLLPWP